MLICVREEYQKRYLLTNVILFLKQYNKERRKADKYIVTEILERTLLKRSNR
jgi:hypothetical protein